MHCFVCGPCRIKASRRLVLPRSSYFMSRLVPWVVRHTGWLGSIDTGGRIRDSEVGLLMSNGCVDLPGFEAASAETTKLAEQGGLSSDQTHRKTTCSQCSHVYRCGVLNLHQEGGNHAFNLGAVAWHISICCNVPPHLALLSVVCLLPFYTSRRNAIVLTNVRLFCAQEMLYRIIDDIMDFSVISDWPYLFKWLYWILLYEPFQYILLFWGFH
jgi:hypothetical protein